MARIRPKAILLAVLFFAKLKVRSWLRNIHRVSASVLQGPEEVHQALIQLTVWEARRPRSCALLHEGLPPDSDFDSDESYLGDILSP